jgi:hypothetical protein
VIEANKELRVEPSRVDDEQPGVPRLSSGARQPQSSCKGLKAAPWHKSLLLKMVELKIRQGSKPGHGDVLPVGTVSEEISCIRGVPIRRDCISPFSHSCFSTPIGMMQFIGERRRLSRQAERIQALRRALVGIPRSLQGNAQHRQAFAQSDGRQDLLAALPRHPCAQFYYSMQKRRA